MFAPKNLLVKVVSNVVLYLLLTIIFITGYFRPTENRLVR